MSRYALVSHTLTCADSRLVRSPTLQFLRVYLNRPAPWPQRCYGYFSVQSTIQPDRRGIDYIPTLNFQQVPWSEGQNIIFRDTSISFPCMVDSVKYKSHHMARCPYPSDASEDGGSLRVWCRNADEKSNIPVSAANAGSASTLRHGAWFPATKSRSYVMHGAQRCPTNAC